MSILISGIEMPKGNDPITLFIYPDGVVVLNEMFGPLGRYTAYPVPPHGRLIDGDVAEGIYFTEEDENGKDFCDGILYAADWISEQPTIIPADRRERDV